MHSKRLRRFGVLTLGIALTTVHALGRHAPTVAASGAESTDTPIRHVIVIFQENVSFDHYFATYPVAANRRGEPAFHARPDTPTVNGLDKDLRTHNPNSGRRRRVR